MQFLLPLSPPHPTPHRAKPAARNLTRHPSWVVMSGSSLWKKYEDLLCCDCLNKDNRVLREQNNTWHFFLYFFFIFFIIVKTVVVPDNYCGTCASTVAPECLNLCLSECHIKHNCLFKVKKFIGKFVVKIITHCIPIMESCLGVRFNVSWFFWEDSVMLQPYTYHCMKIVGR